MKLGLIGNNISYSLSPFIHTFLLNHMHVSGTYELIDLSELEFAKLTIATLKSYDGLNVTIPYKTEIIEKFTNPRLTETVLKMQAANCLHIQNDNVTCYNTDGYGFIQPLLQRKDFSPKQVLILGTGGAMKAVKLALEETYPSCHIQIASRKPTKTQIAYCDLAIQDTSQFDLIVNTTPVCPYQFSNLKQDVILYDLNYRDEKCQFLHLHPQAEHINGITMLVYQAIKSFEIWNDCIVNSEIIRQLFTEIEVNYGIKQ